MSKRLVSNVVITTQLDYSLLTYILMKRKKEEGERRCCRGKNTHQNQKCYWRDPVLKHKRVKQDDESQRIIISMFVLLVKYYIVSQPWIYLARFYITRFFLTTGPSLDPTLSSSYNLASSSSPRPPHLQKKMYRSCLHSLSSSHSPL